MTAESKMLLLNALIQKSAQKSFKFDRCNINIKNECAHMCMSPLHSLFSVWTGGTVAAGISGSALPARAAGHTNVPSEGERKKKVLKNFNSRMKEN